MSVVEEVRRAAPAGRRAPAAWTALGVLVLLASTYPVALKYLVNFPDEIWQVDLEVYREGARSLVDGRQVYGWLTDNPQYLPFTYPPFAALVGTVLLLAPFGVVGWVWSGLQLGLLWVCTGIAFRPLLGRFDARRGLAHGVVAALLMRLVPVQEGIRFGQVNAVLVTLCLVDLCRADPPGGRAPWWPRGSLVGLAAAVKLTPAVFWGHQALARRWRELAVSVGTAAAATVATALFAPSASLAYWTDALLDPGRLGPNANTQNQSMRGMLLRLGPPPGPLLSLAWLALVGVVAVLGYRLARRLDRLGEPVAVVAVLGMMAVLISPVSWTHHLYWAVPVLGALLGDARDMRRVVVTALGGWLLATQLPWSGTSWRADGGFLAVVGAVAEQAYCWFALAALGALWWLVARRTP